MKRNVALLALCQALFMTINVVLISTSALVGLALAPSAALATLPLGLQFVANMTIAMPASLLMRRIGRRAGFAVGLVIGSAGAAVCAISIVELNFWGFGAGAFLIGTFGAFGQFYRFAAADVADDGYRARAISLVMAGGIVAAFAGPNLARWTSESIPSALFAGTFASLVLVNAVSLAVLAFIRIPPPTEIERHGAGRRLAEIGAQPKFLVAVLAAMVGYGAMSVLMTSTPLAMKGCGFDFDDTAIVIEWHVMAMFAPSFVTGELIRRYGIMSVITAGGTLQIAAAAINLAGVDFANFWMALVLLGVGWNFLFVGGTTLLTETYRPEEKASAQGLNDLLVYGTVAATATSSGALYDTVGWTSLNAGVVPILVAVLAAVAWVSRTRPDPSA